jgi:hypothetical protein
MGQFQMSDIMIHCPITGLAVPTGVTTEAVVFETLPNIALPMYCPSCERIHNWMPLQAWVKGEAKPRQRRQISN